MSVTLLREPRSGVTTVSSTASPLTKIGNTSTAATTTYTTTTITDATAWNLSALTAGEIARGIWAITADGYRGQVTAVNDTTDVVTVDHWVIPEGIKNNKLKPTDGNACTFHRVSYCRTIIVSAYDANTVTVYAGFNSTLPSDGTDGDEIIAQKVNAVRIYSAEIPFDVSKLYVVCASTSPKLSWVAT